MKNRRIVNSLGWIGIALLFSATARAGESSRLPDTIEKIRPAVVAVGTFQRTRRPPSVFRGTGFAVADGLHVITNAHVLPERVDNDKKEIVAVFAGKANAIDMREATKIAEDRDHDIAILKITGRPLTALALGDSNRVREGETYAFTGFPI